MTSRSAKNMHFLIATFLHFIIAADNFDGVALQGAGKAGEFIPDDNKKAVAKVNYTGA